MPNFFPLRWGLPNFLPRQDWNLYPSDLSLPIREDDRHENHWHPAHVSLVFMHLINCFITFHGVDATQITGFLQHPYTITSGSTLGKRNGRWECVDRAYFTEQEHTANKDGYIFYPSPSYPVPPTLNPRYPAV
jgi:hypothetical protein